jgi:CrcB protein
MPPVSFPPSTIAWVAAGGALGASLRFVIGEWARRTSALDGFPWATLGINVTGSLLLGVIAGSAMIAESTSPQMRAFLTIGVLGGFTTFSSFSLETVALAQTGAVGRAAVYAGVSVVAAVGAAALGIAMGRA